MRVVLVALAILPLSAGASHAEDMVATNPEGIMCRDAKVLADSTAPDGSAKKSVMIDPFSATARRFMASCKDAGSGMTVHVVTKRKNTSIVTYNGETWYVPNIDFMTPMAGCIKDGRTVTLTGRIESAFARTDEVDSKKGYHYPRLTLDTPVCYLGNQAEKAGRYISLPATSVKAAAALNKMIGQHVTISGMLTSPDTTNQPPDNMMMFDPTVEPAG